MKTCPFCAEEIQDEAIKCRYCGEFLDGRPRSGRQMMAGYPSTYWGYEYRSKCELFGWPLVHIVQGIDPNTGLPRVAKGVIAIGSFAVGLFAVGGLTLGGFAIGGLSVGLIALGGVTAGGVSLGGVALGLYLAAGGLAISTTYAIGGLALAPHAIGSTGTDPELLRLIEKWWSSLHAFFSGPGR